jgi:hypothetical protein
VKALGPTTRHQVESLGSEKPPADAVTTGVRLVIGTASLGLEALTSRLRALGDQPNVPDATPPSLAETASASDIVVGLASRGVRAAFSLGARGADLALRAARTTGAASETLEKLVPDFLNEPMDQARDRARERIRRLGATGKEELDRSRAIARAALEDGLDALFARLADSRELQFVIRTQSVTAAEEAVDGIRDEAARIDDRLEGAARRLLGRRPKPPAVPSP